MVTSWEACSISLIVFLFRLIVNWISKTVHDCDADFVILLSNYMTRDVYQKIWLLVFIFLLFPSFQFILSNLYLFAEFESLSLIGILFILYWLLNSFVFYLVHHNISKRLLLRCDIWMVIYEFVTFYALFIGSESLPIINVISRRNQFKNYSMYVHIGIVT